jgi:hypothetical protein
MANIRDLPRGGDLIVNTDELTRRNLTKVGDAGERVAGPTAAAKRTVADLRGSDLIGLDALTSTAAAGFR